MVDVAAEREDLAEREELEAPVAVDVAARVAAPVKPGDPHRVVAPVADEAEPRADRELDRLDRLDRGAVRLRPAAPRALPQHQPSR